ncbi:hypothetical protein ACIA5C_14265 [Actinoplanes sp. NPDC051343]|uniref:hypothetical protein n=1 Tax=Actinoplanes sp. NPDC051343 TaxID=3363906 RepID=UPI0037B78022
MEAVPATIGARRTVRLAAALVVGQIFLVAIVGWMTLTRPGDRPATGASGVDRMAAPPAWIAPAREPSFRKPSSTSPAESARAHTTEQAPVDPANPAKTSAGTAQSPGPAPISLAPFGAAGPAPSDPLALTPPSSGTATSPKATPSPSAGPAGTAGTGGSVGTGGSGGLGVSGSASPTPGTVPAGRPCDHWGALARADDGRMVRCLPGRYYRLRWKIV